MDVFEPPPAPVSGRRAAGPQPVKLVLPFGTLTHYARGEFFAVCKNRRHTDCRMTGSSKEQGALLGRPLAYLYSWLCEGGHELATNANNHKWLVKISRASRVLRRDEMVADDRFAALLGCERKLRPGESPEP